MSWKTNDPKSFYTKGETMKKSDLLKQYKTKLESIKATAKSETAAVGRANDIMTGINLATENKYEKEIYDLYSNFVHEVMF